MAGKRSSPNFTNPRFLSVPPAVPTEFDEMVEALGLSPEDFPYSVSLKEWAHRNKSIRYVPSELLMRWGMVDKEDLI